MFVYKPKPFESFEKSAKRMSDIANRNNKKVVLVVDGVRYVAKPRNGFSGLLKFHKNIMDKEYYERYLTPKAREATRIWIITRFNEINTLAAEAATA